MPSKKYRGYEVNDLTASIGRTAKQDCKDGVALNANPYDFTSKPCEHVSWEFGWNLEASSSVE